MTSYFDNLAQWYDNLYQDNISRAENTVVQDLLKKNIQLNWNKQRVLDIWCGTGLIPELIWDSIWTYYGFDISPEMIAIAQKKFPTSTYKFEIWNCNSFEFKLFKNLNLVVSTFGSASYIDDLPWFLSCIYPQLSQDAHVFLMFYSRFSVKNILNRDKRLASQSFQSQRPYSFRHTDDESNCTWPEANFYTAMQLKKIIKDTPFRACKIIWLNAFADLGDPGEKSVDEWKDELHQEILTVPTDLAHSLILTLTK
jgi:SAM-dependent methyltransferase